MLYNLLRRKYETLNSTTTCKALNKTAPDLYSKLPQCNDFLIKECDKLI